MKNGWTQHRLRDVTTKIGSGATPKGGKASYKQSGISLIRSLNVHDGEFRTKDLAFIDDVQAKQFDNVVVEAGDVLLNIIYFYLRSPEARSYLTSRAQGASSTMKTIGKQVVQDIPVPLPTLIEQKQATKQIDAIREETQRSSRRTTASNSLTR